ncbi:MAG: D-glycero-beta-D-manno-heptose-7-phosphate kinase [Vicinamibacterales bacterium]
MTAALLSSIVDRLAGRTVVIVGDVMLDQFLFGRVERISPEAPVPVVRFARDEFRPGGAANVANNVAALGGRPLLVAVVGEDEAAARLAVDLSSRHVAVDGLIEDPSRPTTRKLRVVTTRNQQVARVDYEDETDLAPAIEAAVIQRARAAIEGADVVVVSDYLKGVVTRPVVSALADAAGRRGIPLLVDPKVPHVDRYAGATLVTPNHHEAEAVTLMRIRNGAEAAAAARAFRDRARAKHVLVTRGEHGMWLLEGDHDCELPAVAREVSDVTGAGDTVIATLALGIAAAASLADAARLANHAAGVVVGKFGPATVSPQELREALRSRSSIG